MDSSFKDLFAFTRGEKRGVLILSGIILLLLILLMLLPWVQQQQSADMEKWRQVLQSFVIATDDNPVYAGRQAVAMDSSSILNWDEMLFSFDPNRATSDEFKHLGLKSWQIGRILKFRERGGVFRKKEDFRKIYGITPLQYEKLEPFIAIDSSFFKKTYPESRAVNTRSSIRKRLCYEINSADSLQLDSLYGIGPVLASRIIRYRNRLGGFVRLDQMKEVYGFPSSFYDSIAVHLTVDTERIDYIHLNSISPDELRRHPYLNVYQAQAIIRFRELKGRFTRNNQVIENQLIPPEVWNKIKPYLRVD